MQKAGVFIILIFILFLGYSMHKLIKKFINPRDSASHALLFFLAHFIGIFILAFITSLAILKLGRFLIQA
ncbi:MAG: hypothetical protein ABIT96_13470 [Ferruginibacter sp.]